MEAKNYTDIEQSKKLAKILPLESADMKYGYIAPYDYSDRMFDGGYDEIPYPKDFFKVNPNFSENEYDGELPCWSLTALLEFIRNRHDCNYVALTSNKASLWCLRTSYYNHVWEDAEEVSEDAVDACVKMILRLEDLKR